jgi:cytochrome c-type biogenesis protein
LCPVRGVICLTMLVFGVGAAIPLMIIGPISREAALRWRNHLLSAGSGMKSALGIPFIAIGMLVLLGLDKMVETILVNASPRWLTDLTTRF